MEQQSKYYTPNISELYVGYELEVEDFNRVHENGVEWVKTVIEHGGNHERNTHEEIFDGTTIQGIEARNDVYIRNTYRTKYLDQSDIESLGWEFDKSRGIPLEYHYTKEVNLKKYKLTKLSTKIHIGILQQGNTLYEGECKSINELRKIMEWLNIK